MRFTILLFLSAILFIGCAPTDNVIEDPDDIIAVSSSCTANSTIKELYIKDAERMALRIILSDANHPWKDSVVIYRPQVGEILQGLLAVHNGFNMPYRDTVIAVYGIHSHEDIVLDRLLVEVDQSFNWVQQWKLGNQISGNNTVDNIMDKYGLTLDNYYQWSIGDYAMVKSSESLNLNALAKVFESVPGVLSAEVDAVIGGGNDITYINHPEDNYKEYIYSVGYGDCPAGCTKRRYYRFHVITDACRLEFRGSWGDPAP